MPFGIGRGQAGQVHCGLWPGSDQGPTLCVVESVARQEFDPFTPMAGQELECVNRLRDHLLKNGQPSPESNLASLLDPDAGRFEYFNRYLPTEAFGRLLVSGCAVGSEMILARNLFGFKEVCGSDVNGSLIDLAQRRLKGQAGFSAILYDGKTLPYRDSTFSAVVSAHVIEHTASPLRYFLEQLRVLAAGGFLFLEFPNRYHTTELHTGLPSLEWLPWPLRNWGLRFKASRYSTASALERVHYDEVRRELRPVSVWQARLWLRLFSLGRIVHHYDPAPGYSRIVIQKWHDAPPRTSPRSRPSSRLGLAGRGDGSELL